MKIQKQKSILALDKFDTEISLWQLLPSGSGNGLKRLKTIVDSIQNSQVEQLLKPFSLLVAGTQGTRSYARCFLRALGLDHPLELPSHLLQATPNEVFNFFAPTRLCDSYIINSFSLLQPSTLKTLYEIITTGEYSVYNNIRKTTEVVPVLKPIIMATHSKNNVPYYLTEKNDHIVELEDYTDQQLELIVLQRLKYCGLDYEEEKVLKLVVDYGSERLHDIIRLLKSAITVMLADGRTTLTIEDVQTATTNS